MDCFWSWNKHKHKIQWKMFFFGLAEERANLSEEICMWGWVIDWLSIHCHRRSCLSTMEKTKRYRSVCFSTSLFSVLLFQYRLFHLIHSVSRWHQMVCWVTERSRERGSGGYTRSNLSSSYCLRYGLIYLMRKGESTLWRMQCFSWLPLQPRNSRRRSAKRKLRRAMSLAQRSASLSSFYREMW